MDEDFDSGASKEPLGMRVRHAGGDLFSVLRSRIYCLVITMILGLCAGFYYLSIAPRIYQSTATVLVKTSSSETAHEIPDGDLDLRMTDAINTIVGKFKLPSLYQDMLVDNAALVHDPEIVPEKLNWTPRWLRSKEAAASKSAPPVQPALTKQSVLNAAAAMPSGGSATAGRELIDDPARAALAMEAARIVPAVRGCYEVTNRRQTRLVDITVSHTSPRMAQSLANAVVNAYNKTYVDRRSDRTSDNLKRTKEEKEETLKQLGAAHNAQAAYHTALILVAKLQEQEAKLSALLLRYRDKHPDVIQSRQLLRDTQQAFMREFAAARASSADATYWKSEPAAPPDADLTVAVSQSIRLLQARSKVLESEIDSRNKAYESLLGQIKDLMALHEDKEAEIVPLEPALEGELIQPRPPLIYATAGLGGLLLGVILALLLSRLDSRVHTVAGLEQLTGTPVIASVAALRKEVLIRAADAAGGNLQMDQWAPDLFFRDNGAKSIEAEMIRALRTAILLLGPQELFKSILFTSALPGEGKSFISANVAISLAMQGSRVLLVDLDLRRPRQHILFGRDRCKGAGVVDVLAGQCQVGAALHTTGLDNLYLLPAGSPAPNPAELLSVAGIKQLLGKLAGSFDRIIVDTAPMLPVSDTRLISRAVDACILVAGAEKTPKGAILRALDLLGGGRGDGQKSRFGGCVLNGTVETRRNLGYNYSYGYYGKYGGEYKSYGVAYGEDEDGVDEKQFKKRKK